MEQRAIHLGFAEIIAETQRFINQNWVKVGSLNLIAAFARLAQEGGFGPIATPLFTSLELLVILARLGLLVLVLGQGTWQAGFQQIAAFPKLISSEWGIRWKQLGINVFWNKIALSINLIVMMVVGTLTNLSIQLLTHTFLLKWLKNKQWVAAQTTPWGVTQFLENLSITPFTEVFTVLLVLFLFRKSAQQ